MLILPAEADESVVSTAMDRITKVISASGGEVSNIDRWGRRRFAYELKHLTEGYYVVAKFTAQPETQAELDRVLVLPEQRANSRQNRRDQKEAASSPVPAETA
jgi:small subunit ribosomal protein S6